MSNFAFLPEPLKTVRDAAVNAEGHINGDPRSACFQCRFALESIVHWLYRYERRLNKPYDESLGTLLHEPSFQELMPPQVFQKARLIQKKGNQAVHNARDVQRGEALQVVKDLHHLCRWLVRLYAQDALANFRDWDDSKLPAPADTSAMVSRDELLALEKKLSLIHI